VLVPLLEGHRDLDAEGRQVFIRGVIRLRMTSGVYDPCLGPQIDFGR